MTFTLTWFAITITGRHTISENEVSLEGRNWFNQSFCTILNLVLGPGNSYHHNKQYTIDKFDVNKLLSSHFPTFVELFISPLRISFPHKYNLVVVSNFHK